MRGEKKSAIQARQFNRHLKELMTREQAEQKTSYYTEQLEETYRRIELLEQKEKQHLSELQHTMKEHNTLVAHEKRGSLSTDVVDQTISKFNL